MHMFLVIKFQELLKMLFFQKQEDGLFKKQQITFATLKGEGVVEDKN